MTRKINFDIEQEINKIKKLRKCEKLEQIDIINWTKEELLDLIKNYMTFYEMNHKHVDIEEFIKKGFYKKMSTKEIEELKI